MVANKYHLAQINIGRIRAPLDHPVMAGFVRWLDTINTLAEHSPGFVWRLQTEAGNATAITAYPDPRILLNITVWQTVEELFEFVYRSAHNAALKERKEWFEPYNGPYTALWWIKAGHLPTVEEAKAKLELLSLQGPTPEAFTFKTRFPAPGQ